MPFKPGVSGNPAGRAPMRKVMRNLAPKNAKDIRGLNLVASIADHKLAPLQMRLQAGSILAQYQETKPGERIGRDLQLPEATSVDVAARNIARIGAEAAADRLPPDLATKLISHQQSYIDAKVNLDTEARLAVIEAALERISPSAEIAVEGGLPPLPGVDIIMPPRVLTPPPAPREDSYRSLGGRGRQGDGAKGENDP
jgi:hypothetical protein